MKENNEKQEWNAAGRSNNFLKKKKKKVWPDVFKTLHTWFVVTFPSFFLIVCMSSNSANGISAQHNKTLQLIQMKGTVVHAVCSGQKSTCKLTPLSCLFKLIIEILAYVQQNMVFHLRNLANVWFLLSKMIHMQINMLSFLSSQLLLFI